MQDELSVQMNVLEILTRWPETIPVFLQHRMNCVGCSMSRFETLHDAVAIYHLNVAAFLGELDRSIRDAAGNERRCA